MAGVFILVENVIVSIKYLTESLCLKLVLFRSIGKGMIL